MPMCERWNVEIRGIEGKKRMAREVGKKNGNTVTEVSGDGS